MILGGALCLLGAAGVWYAAKPGIPSPPVVPTSGLDPAVARLLDEARQRIRANPRSGAAWGKFGEALAVHGFPAQARLAFLQAERFASRDARWPYRHALVLLEAGEPAESVIARLQSAVDLCQDLIDIPRLRLAQFLFERGRIEAAEAQFARLLALQPAHPSALLGMARIRLGQGRVREGLDLLSRCADDPHVTKAAHALRAQMLLRLGETAAAEAAARKSAACGPDLPWPDPYFSETPDLLVGRKGLMEQAQQLIDAQRLGEALQVLAAITNDYPEDGEAYYGMGLILNRQGRSAEAEAVLRQQVRLSPASAHGHGELGAALIAQKKSAEAIAQLERAVQLRPTWGQAHYSLAYACSRLGRAEEAIAHLRDALRQEPNHADSYSLLADLLAIQERHAEALEALERVAQLRPKWGPARFNLGYVCARMGKTDPAIRHLREALELDPKDLESRLLLAELLRGRGETNEPARLLREVLAENPLEERAQSLLRQMGQKP